MRVVVLHRLRHVNDVGIAVVVPAHRSEPQNHSTNQVFLLLSSYSMLNSLRSAWTSRASWNIFLMFWTTCRYSSRALDSDSAAFFSRGAGLAVRTEPHQQTAFSATDFANMVLHVVLSNEAHQQNMTSEQQWFWTWDSSHLQPRTHKPPGSTVVLKQQVESFQYLTYSRFWFYFSMYYKGLLIRNYLL